MTRPTLHPVTKLASVTIRSFVWPFLVVITLAVLSLTFVQMGGLLVFLTGIFWVPAIFLSATLLLCARRPLRIISVVAAGCVVWRCFAAFVHAAEITHLCIDAPALAASIVTSGKPARQRLLVLRDWSAGFAGSALMLLVYDDTGVLGTANDTSARPLPPSFEMMSDTAAQLCIGRSEPIVWRFYICTI